MAVYVIMCNDVPMHVFNGPYEGALAKLEELANKAMLNNIDYWTEEHRKHADHRITVYEYYRRRNRWRQLRVPFTDWYRPLEGGPLRDGPLGTSEAEQGDMEGGFIGDHLRE